MSRNAFPRLEREYNEREERLDEIRARVKVPTFAALVAKWQAITETGHNAYTDAFAAFLMPEVLECIREQQAALKNLLPVAEETEERWPNDHQFTDPCEEAREVIAKWSLK